MTAAQNDGERMVAALKGERMVAALKAAGFTVAGRGQGYVRMVRPRLRSEWWLAVPVDNTVPEFGDALDEVRRQLSFVADEGACARYALNLFDGEAS